MKRKKSVEIRQIRTQLSIAMKSTILLPFANIDQNEQKPKCIKENTVYINEHDERMKEKSCETNEKNEDLFTYRSFFKRLCLFLRGFKGTYEDKTNDLKRKFRRLLQMKRNNNKKTL